MAETSTAARFQAPMYQAGNWIIAHMVELEEKYDRQYVAANARGEIVAHARTSDALFRKLNRKKFQLDQLAIAFISNQVM